MNTLINIHYTEGGPGEFTGSSAIWMAELLSLLNTGLPGGFDSESVGVKLEVISLLTEVSDAW